MIFVKSVKFFCDPSGVYRVRQFAKQAEIFDPALHLYRGPPTLVPAMIVNTTHSGLIVCVQPTITAVNNEVCWPKVLKPIISNISVEMVYLLGLVTSGHFPSYPVGSINSVF